MPGSALPHRSPPLVPSSFSSKFLGNLVTNSVNVHEAVTTDAREEALDGCPRSLKIEEPL